MDQHDLPPGSESGRNHNDGKLSAKNRLAGHFTAAAQIDFDSLFHPPEDTTFPALRAENNIFEAYRDMRGERRGFVSPTSPEDLDRAEILKAFANQAYLENAIPNTESGGKLTVTSHRVFLEPRMKENQSNHLHSSLVHLKNSQGQSLIMVDNVMNEPRWQNFRHGPVLMLVHGHARANGSITHTPLYSEAAMIGEIRDLDKIGTVDRLINHPYETSYILGRIFTSVARWAEAAVAEPKKLLPIQIERVTLRHPLGTSFDVTTGRGKFKAVVSHDPKTCLIRVTGGRSL